MIKFLNHSMDEPYIKLRKFYQDALDANQTLIQAASVSSYCIEKKEVYFTSVLVSPNDEILEKIKNLNFDYYQLYDVSPYRTKEIKSKFKKKIITALTISSKDDVIKYKDYSEISDIILFDSKGYDKSESCLLYTSDAADE